MDGKIKLIGMDFDSTFVEHTQNGPIVLPELLERLGEFIARGGYAGIVTGRKHRDLRVAVERLGIKWGFPFPNFTIARESYIYTVKNGSDVPWDEHNSITKERTSAKMLGIAKYISGWHASFIAMGYRIHRWELLGDYGLELDFENREEAETAEETLREFIRDECLEGYSVTRNVRLAAVYDSQSGKGNTMIAASKLLGLRPCEMLAIGDSLNDLTMVDGKLGITGACVGNADPLIKKSVALSGGYLGEGTASSGILDVLDRLESEGRLL